MSDFFMTDTSIPSAHVRLSDSIQNHKNHWSCLSGFNFHTVTPTTKKSYVEASISIVWKTYVEFFRLRSLICEYQLRVGFYVIFALKTTIQSGSQTEGIRRVWELSPGVRIPPRPYLDTKRNPTTIGTLTVVNGVGFYYYRFSNDIFVSTRNKRSVYREIRSIDLHKNDFKVGL